MTATKTVHPFAEGAAQYLSRGWRGVLQLPLGQKQPPPAGLTGSTASDASPEQVIQWAKEAPSNIALRLPDTVLGIDIDTYGNKSGAETLRALEAELGALPATWTSSSREQLDSCIRFYRVPAGLKWESILGASIEVIQRSHRYAVVWPSLHPEGRQYRWRTPSGELAAEVPAVAQLAELPPAWIRHLSQGDKETSASASLPLNAEPETWTSGSPCGLVCLWLERLEQGLQGTQGSRHDTALGLQLGLVSLALKGHSGTGKAAQIAQELFADKVAPDRGGGRSEALREWKAGLQGAWHRVSRDLEPDLCTGVDCGSYRLDLQPTVPAPTSSSENDLEPSDGRKWTGATGDTLRAARGKPRKQAEVLTDSDGAAFLYRKQVNLLCGDPGAGKSWLALEAVRQELTKGNKVLMLDAENLYLDSVTRLTALGLPDSAWDRLTIFDAEQLSHGFDFITWEELLATEWDLVIVDSFTAALSLMINKPDSNSGDSIQQFIRTRLQPLANTGAAVLVLDHKPKAAGGSKSRGSIGSERKLSAIQGAAYTLEALIEPAPGALGTLILTLDKDNAGTIKQRLAANRERGANTQEAAIVELDSLARLEGVETIIRLLPPRPLNERELDETAELAELLRDALENSDSGKIVGAAAMANTLKAMNAELDPRKIKTVLEYGNSRQLFKAYKTGKATSPWIIERLD